MCCGEQEILKQLEKTPLWHMPPLYKQIWLYLLIRANHEGYGVFADGGIQNIKPGQIVTTLNRIAAENSWYVRNRKKKPNKKTVREALKWFKQQGMVKLESNAYRTLITLVE
ncbi:MAG: hypothetical protein JSU72_20315 [Deltaproteobacteria bacterium]|nr:MAG: hypothetical protein JSU72_20315 [Deltaproteobacteria bacterium]